MRTSILILSILLCLSCSSKENKSIDNNLIFNQKDKEILEQIFSVFSDEKETPITALIVKVGTFFKGTPYVAHTLEIEPEKEQLVINLREMDCTTFAENCLAISRTIKSGNHTFNKFAEELKTIRYRDGKLNGYTSRLNYFSDWIFDNDRKKITQSVSEEIANIPYQKPINFMSTHPESYIQLKTNHALVQTIEIQEKELSGRKMFFIPEEELKVVEEKLMDGDIAGITTNIKGLDILHVVILVRQSGKLHILHASSESKKVIISNETLEEYLLKSKLATGIMVARPL